MKCNTVGFLQTLFICHYIVFIKHTRSIFGELTLKILEIVVAHHGHFSFFYKNKMASLKYRKFKILPTYFSGKLRNKSYFIKSDHNHKYLCYCSLCMWKCMFIPGQMKQYRYVYRGIPLDKSKFITYIGNLLIITN